MGSGFSLSDPPLDLSRIYTWFQVFLSIPYLHDTAPRPLYKPYPIHRYLRYGIHTTEKVQTSMWGCIASETYRISDPIRVWGTYAFIPSHNIEHSPPRNRGRWQYLWAP